MGAERKVLVVDAAGPARDELCSALQNAELVPVTAATVEEGLSAVDAERPSLIILEPRLGTDDGFELVAQLRERPGGAELPVLVRTDLDDRIDAAAAFEQGADDVVHRSVGWAELLGRVRAHLRMRRYIEELAAREQDAQATLELTQALASSLDFREILFTVVRRIAEVVQVNRVSIVLTPQDDGERVGYVVVASDDETLSNLRIDLANYPEIEEVLRTREPLTIHDVTTHPILDGVRQSVTDKVGSMTLLPIAWREEPLGVLFLRSDGQRILAERDLNFCRIVANATAVGLRNARVMQSLRDHTQQVTFARFEAERRLQSLKRFATLFDSSADGIAVVDPEGRLLFANPRAYEVLEYDPERIKGIKVRELIHEDDSEMARSLWEGFARGEFPRDVDIRLVRGDGASIVANVSFSSIVDGDGAVLFSFRDVTEARRIESELVETKEFLESLVDASPDGIVAASLDGTILLFNEGAERIYGYSADDVVGAMNVRDLYADDGARTVMQMLRSPQHGGEGRLESTRLSALAAGGVEVPISLSAAMIYRNKTPIATFGIFTDLRDKLQVEARLAQAQQKLAVTEKQALIAELAGTAAHELNQPLTSVMGYAEMLKRKLAKETPEHHAAEIIVREAERMADIVRKIGKITKYETKSYVGAQRILDLEKASAVEGMRGSSTPPERAGSEEPKRTVE